MEAEKRARVETDAAPDGGHLAKKNDDGEMFFDLGPKKRVTIRKFKGQTYVDIREYYNDSDGVSKPGKKGIMLNLEQYKLFAELAPDIDTEIKKTK